MCMVLIEGAQAYSTPCDPMNLCPMGFLRQEYWVGLPCLLQGNLPNPGIEPGSTALQADSLPSEPPGKPLVLIDVLNSPRIKLPCKLRVIVFGSLQNRTKSWYLFTGRGRRKKLGGHIRP